MNTFVMGEIATLLAVTAVAGILIGWCIKSLLSGRFERQVRANVARDVDEATSDLEQMRSVVHKKDAQLQDAVLELQQLRGRDVSLSAGNTTQVEEINDLKVELSKTRQTLDRNRSEFAAFRDEKLHELQSVSNELASFKTGGSVHDKNMNQVHESIAALRTAARENDKIIESLRARNKEADTTVENLRNQLKQSETAQHQATVARQEQERATAGLTTSLQEANNGLEKQKRDYNTMLETKNQTIAQQQSRLDELVTMQSLLKQKEHDHQKLTNELQNTTQRTGSEINDLKRKLDISEQALSDSRIGIQNMQEQVAELTRNSKTQIEQHQAQLAQLNDKHNAELLELRNIINTNDREIQSVNALKTQIESKDAEVVALNDMLRDIGAKRDQSNERTKQLESQLQGAANLQQQLAKSEQQLGALAGALKQRESDYTKLRADTEANATERDNLMAQSQDAQREIARLKTVIGDHEREIQHLNTTVENTAEQTRLISNLQTSLKQKDAEVLKLRSTGDNIAALNSEIAGMNAKIGKHETDLSDAQLRVRNLTAALRARDSEITALRKSAEEQNKSQLDINHLNETLLQRDSELQKLKAQMSSINDERKQATLEIQQLKSEQETEKSKLQSIENQQAQAYRELQTEFNKISTVRDDYESRVKDLQSQLEEQQKQYAEKLNTSEKKVSELQPQISTLQNRITSLSSEKQQLTASLSDAEASKLKLTEREAEIRRLQIDLNESSNNDTLQASLQDQNRKIESLTSAMLERDNEISRLNKIITDNRVGSKQYSSEANLLREEIDAQSKLILSLEDQAENTLQLHKKIATQSTEIESLRADLHLTRNQIQTATSVDHSQEIARLKASLAARDAELNRALATNAAQQPEGQNSRRVVSTRVTRQQSTAASTTPEKPRLFVPHGEKPDSIASPVQGAVQGAMNTSTGNKTTTSATANAENLAGTQMPAQPSTSADRTTATRRALYTGDGYRLKRPDGLDDLALLPGFSNDLADSLRKNDVREFEQVALWTQREVAHYADRLGISAAKAEALQWPNAAREILAGRYRVDAYREAEKN